MESILRSKGQQVLKEILIIDNGSVAIDPGAFEDLAGVRFIRQTEAGLSLARNRALHESLSPWLIFVDDDAIVEDDFLEQASYMCEADFDASGGRYIPLYEEERPRWFKDRWVSSRVLRIDIGQLPDRQYFPGGVSIWKVRTAIEAGSFPVDIGMRALRASYGEEVALQKAILSRGGKLGYNPDLVIRHLVRKEKMTLSWLLSSEHAKGRDSWTFLGEKRSPILWLKILIKSLIKLVVDLANNLICLIRRKELHPQAALADALMPFAYALGRLF